MRFVGGQILHGRTEKDSMEGQVTTSCGLRGRKLYFKIITINATYPEALRVLLGVNFQRLHILIEAGLPS